MLKKKGFTLIELLVVIAIIAILVVLIILALNAARMRARDSARKSDLRAVQTGLELANNDDGSYPAAGYDALDLPGLATADLPHDPTNPDPLDVDDYGYGSNADQDYALGAVLEGEDPATCGAALQNHNYCVGTAIGTQDPAV